MKNLHIRFLFITLIILLSFSNNSLSQVLITDDGTTTPDGSAMLEIKSNDKGMLIPRMSTANREALHNSSTAKPGLLVFDSDLGSFFIYGKTAKGIDGWVDLSSGGTVWEKSGNNVYLANSSYNVGIGTSTPSKKFVIKAENQDDTLFEILDSYGKPLMLITPTLSKFYFNEPTAGVAGGFAVGRYASAKAVSDTALFLVTPDSTRVYTSGTATKGVAGGFAVGRYASAKAAPIQYFNTNISSTRVYTDGSAKGVAGGFAVGRYASAKGDTYKYFYTDIDSTRVYTDGSGAKGVAGGFAVGRYASAKGGRDGSYMYMIPDNYFIGDSSGLHLQQDPSLSSKYNTFFGYKTGMINEVGGSNVFIGYKSGISNNGTIISGDTTGAKNVFLGYKAGFSNTSGKNSVLLGANSGYNMLDADNNVFIGNSAGHGAYNATHTYCSDNVIIGESAGHDISNAQRNVFIGHKTGEKVTTGGNDVFIGELAGQYVNSGNTNVYIGNSAGSGRDENTPNNGGANVFIGNACGTVNSLGNENVFIGNEVGNRNTEGSWNVFIGTGSGQLNQTGGSNVFIGQKTGNSMDASDYNTIIGCSAGENALSGIRNVFLGYKAGLRHFGGNDNIFIGDSAGANIYGNNKLSHRNIFLGNFAGANISEAIDNVFIGNKAGEGVTTGITGDYNVAIGESAGNNLSTGERNVFVGNQTGFTNKDGSYNTFIGYQTGFLSTGSSNSMLGNKAGYYNTSGSGNTFMGNYSGYYNQDGQNNSFYGAYSGEYNQHGGNNTAMGFHAAERSGGDNNINIGSYAGYQINGDRNIFIGAISGYKSGQTSQEGNIFIGYYAGHTEVGNNKLIIENDGNANYNPLIYGEFDNDYVRIGGTLNINNQYSLPTNNGNNGEVLITDGGGGTSWGVPSNQTISARNGLSMDGSYVELGGSLVQNTYIYPGNYYMGYYLYGAGDFFIYDGSEYSLYIQDDGAGGNVGIGTNTPTEQLTVYKVGDVTTKIQTDDGNSANLSLYENTSGSDYGFKFEYDGSVDKLHLWSKGFSGNDARRVTFSKYGDVGIGTTTPNELLEIGGDGRAFFGDGGGSNRKGLLIDGVETAGARLEAYDYSTGTGLDLVINTVGGGNVGIGTSAPSSKLSVEGIDNGTYYYQDGLIYSVNKTTSGGVGITGRVSESATSTGDRFGVSGISWYGLSNNYGLYGYGYGGTASYGVYAFAAGGSSNNYGVYAKAANGSTSWAGYFDGGIKVTGKVSKNISTKTGSYTVTDTDGLYTILVNNTSATATITLPSASTNTGRIIRIKRVGSYYVYINTQGTETLDGSGSKTMDVRYEGYIVQSDGTNWWVIGIINDSFK